MHKTKNSHSEGFTLSKEERDEIGNTYSLLVECMNLNNVNVGSALLAASQLIASIAENEKIPIKAITKTIEDIYKTMK